MEKKISLQDLSENLSSRNEMPRKDAELFVRSVFEIIEEYLKTDKMVKIKGLGTFKLVSMDSRESVDVNTGERILINGYIKVSFTPDPVLRDEINKPFSQFETVMLFDKTDLAELEKLDQQSDEALMGADSDVLEETDVLSEENVEESADVYSEESADVISSEQDVNEGITVVQDEMTEEKNVSEEIPVVDEDSKGQVEAGKSGDCSLRYAAEQMSPEHISAMSGEENTTPVNESAEVKSGSSSPVQSVASTDSVPETGPGEYSVPQSQPGAHDEETDNSVTDKVLSGTDSNVNQSQKHPDTMNVEHLHADYQHVDEQHADEIEVDHQRVKTQTAGNQHVDMQKVEHQTIENQHIVQMTGGRQSRKRYMPPVWVIILCVLIVLLLMLGSYFVGYYRLLCPSGCETVSYVSRSEVVRDLPVIKPQDSLKVGSDSNATKKTISNKVSGKDSVKSVQIEKSQENVLPKAQSEAASKAVVSKKNGSSAVKKNPVAGYPQLPGGKYEIIGTRETVRLKNGETLRNLALKYYGSKNYVPYIAIYNKIDNPDIIAENSEIKIPELRRKEE